MKRNIIGFALLLLMLLALWLIKPFSKDSQEEVVVTHTMVVEQIEELGRLEVVKYNISDVMEYTKRRDWLPNSKVALLVAGEVIACVDLTKIREANIRINKDTVSITLPIPEICSFKIDHTRSKVYDVKYGLWETHELVDEAYKDAEKQIYEQALKMGIAEESKVNARKSITPLLQMLGFKTVYINFEEAPHGEKERMRIRK